MEKAELTRVEAKARDLESRLDLESGQKNRADTQLARLKEANDKLAADLEDFKAAAERDKDAARRAGKTTKDVQEEMAEMRRKDSEAAMKKSELESRASTAEEALETARADLKLAFKRIHDLQSALEDRADSEDESDDDDIDDDDTDDDDEDEDDSEADEEAFLRNRRPLFNRSSGLGSAASSNHSGGSLQSLDESTSTRIPSTTSPRSPRRMDSYAGGSAASSAAAGGNAYEDDDL